MNTDPVQSWVPDTVEREKEREGEGGGETARERGRAKEYVSYPVLVRGPDTVRTLVVPVCACGPGHPAGVSPWFTRTAPVLIIVLIAG